MKSVTSQEVAPIARRTRSAFLPGPSASAHFASSASSSIFTPIPQEPSKAFLRAKVSPLSPLTFSYPPAVLTPDLTPEPVSENLFEEKKKRVSRSNSLPQPRAVPRSTLTPSPSDLAEELQPHLFSPTPLATPSSLRPSRQARSRSSSLMIGITPPNSSELPKRSAEILHTLASPVSPVQRPRRRSRGSAVQSPSSLPASSAKGEEAVEGSPGEQLEGAAASRQPFAEESRASRTRARAEARKLGSNPPQHQEQPSHFKSEAFQSQPLYSPPMTRRRSSLAVSGHFKAQEGADQQRLPSPPPRRPSRRASTQGRRMSGSAPQVHRSHEEEEEEEQDDSVEAEQDDSVEAEQGDEAEEEREGSLEAEEEREYMRELPQPSPRKLRSHASRGSQPPKKTPLTTEVISLLSDSDESTTSGQPQHARSRRRQANYTSDDDLGPEDTGTDTDTEVEEVEQVDEDDDLPQAKKRTWSQRSAEADASSSSSSQRKRLSRSYSCNLHGEEQQLPKPELVRPTRPFQSCLYPPSGVQKESMDDLERDIWGWSIHREADYLPSPNYQDQQPFFAQSFRNILVDWMFEVSQDFKLHRETTHLAINYVDRYLSRSPSVAKSQFQLIGITALFIAAKLEEIYPPKVTYFSDVTDGLFSIKDIHAMELSMLNTLKWRLVVPTLNFWVNFFLQNSARITGPSCDEAVLKTTKDLKHFFGPKFMVEKYLRIMALLDAAAHSFESLQFPYSLLAAAAVSLILTDADGDMSLVCKSSGFSREQLEGCLRWLVPLQSYPGVSEIRKRPNAASCDWFNFQTHNDLILPFFNRKRS